MTAWMMPSWSSRAIRARSTAAARERNRASRSSPLRMNYSVSLMGYSIIQASFRPRCREVRDRITRLHAILLGNSCAFAHRRERRPNGDFVRQSWTLFIDGRTFPEPAATPCVEVAHRYRTGGPEVGSRFGEMPFVRPAAASRRIHKMFQLQIFVIRSMAGVFVRSGSER